MSNDRNYQNLVAEVASKSNLGREKILSLIQEKKTKVGGGYLTDQGALFLVASDLDVDLNYNNPGSGSAPRIDENQKSIELVGRLLSLGRPRSFVRKSSPRRGIVAHLVLYDGTSRTRITVWDSAVSRIFSDELGLRPGDLLKISRAYTRVSSFNSSPSGGEPGVEIGVNDGGGIEKLTVSTGEGGTNTIPPLEAVLVSPSSLPETSRYLAVRGKVEEDVRKSQFTRSDGSGANYLAFSISDVGGNPVRVVLWNNEDPSYNEITRGQEMTLLNVRTRLSNFQNSTSLEIHGDEGTCVLEYFDRTKAWMKSQLQEPEGNKQTAQITSDIASNSASAAIPFVGRVLALKKPEAENERANLLIMDSQRRIFSVVASGESVRDTAGISVEDIVVCRPDTVDYSALKVTSSKANSIVKTRSKRPDIPGLESLYSTVEKLGDRGIASLELICLSDPSSRDVSTKDGVVRRSEITVADHTGELKVYGWRNLSRMLEGFATGDRIVLHAVEVQIFEGKKFLVLKNYSEVRKKKSLQ